MSLEVEAKAPLKGAREKVEAIGAKFVKTESQKDTYFSHPVRDFKKTDEALRIRQSAKTLITYKGPKRDSDLKVRTEIEFEVPEAAFELLESLGFVRHHVVEKVRHTYSFDGLIVCADDVGGLGEYVEVESGSEDDGEKIKQVLKLLGVEEAATTSSYSELLGR